MFDGPSYQQRFPGPAPVAQIAALAELNPRTVTNAIARGELTAVATADGDHAIGPADLYPWLLNRSGFIAWTGSSTGRAPLAARALNATTRVQYGRTMAEIASWVPEAPLPDGWADVRDGRYGPDGELLQGIARTLGLPNPPAVAAAGVHLALRERAENSGYSGRYELSSIS